MDKLKIQGFKACAIFIFLILVAPSRIQILDEILATEDRQSAMNLSDQAPLALSSSPSQTGLTSSNASVQGISLVTVIISLLSLGVSIAVAYFSNFRQANIKLSFGRNIIFFAVPTNVSVVAGSSRIGVGFNIPITFYNWSPQGGTVHRIRLVVSKQGNDDYYDMAWTTFVRIGSGGNFEDEDLAQPIPVEGRSSVNKIIRFDWDPEEGGKEFDVQDSNYELRVYGWTDGTDKPNLEYKIYFKLKKEPHYKRYEESVARRTSLSIWIPLDENEKPNQILSKNSIDRLYSARK